MKCPFCNSEIEEGSLYCNHCGSPMQVVPDYNVLEDDVLPSMLDSTKKKPVNPEEKKEIEKHLNKRWIIIVSILLTAILGGFIGTFIYTHSFSYYCKKAETSYIQEDYTMAISLYGNALKQRETVEVYIGLGKAQQALEYYDEAEHSYLKAYELNNKNEEVILLLSLLYEETNDYEAMEELLSMDLTSQQLEIVNEYAISGPKFSLKSGTYTDDIEIAITGKKGYEIYYTLDGTEPSSHNGVLYEEPITISKQGTTIVSAVCVNENGKYGVVSKETYEITYVAPSAPALSPTGGRLTKETYVTISCDVEDGDIYYTWDGTVPTTNSSRYTGPILVPEGNNVLSVIVIDKHGMTSKVVKGNYIYYP
ncbi:MAG: chitobiase/beta-hexosaminidase C-terminal domain-containing protein [Lachnospiraceae bacterium]|nr:chitobiase/beta-hexosaminidase C-terminal domain-containing protein [Lachnospiraceae bacterium]